MKSKRHITAIFQAVFVTFLWSTSWVLIKFGLRHQLPALSFAGLRYFIAFLCLVPFVLFNRHERERIAHLTRSDWFWLTALGLFVIKLTQGAQFLSLAYLPAAMVSLVANLTSIVVGVAGIWLIHEVPSRLQWLGVGITVAGVGVYFLPWSMPGAVGFGLLIAVAGMIFNAVSSLLGRKINSLGHLSPLMVTFVSMGIGSVLLLLLGILTQGIGTLMLSDWAIIGWLAVVNTAFAFTLWNHILRTLTAIEASVINSLMMPQIAALAYLFLGETISARKAAGLLLVGAGIVIVQKRRQEK